MWEEWKQRLENLTWTQKLLICLTYDILDMTVGRLLIPVPFLGEVIGCAIFTPMFGKAGLLYGLEALDMTEQIDGFIPTATLIALANRPR
ncbi:MAG: hypothetical protein ABL983_10285 [Nitrospira sp.]